MTRNPHGSDPEDNPEGNRKLDEDAAWRAIVENYGEPAMLDDSDLQPDEQRAPSPPADDTEDVRWEDPLNTQASWEDEGHFVPPVPPPMPPVDPRRKLAWSGLFGSPGAMLLGVAVGWEYPRWLAAVLVVSFVAGFLYLVATMPRSGPGDGSSDDGAVV